MLRMARVHKSASVKVAKLAGVQAQLDVHAQKIRARAAANAATAAETGEYSSKFEVEVVQGKKGVMDRLVTNTHPASSAVELGHFAEKADGSTGQFVPGRFDLIRAIK